MSKTLKVILKTINFIIISVAALLVIFIIGARLLGLQMFTVLSGSMEPEYPTGSLIYVKEIDPAELEVGDVITYRLSGSTIATHRIVEIMADAEDPDEFQFRTKGDANDSEDAVPVESSSLIGTPVLTLPKIGVFASSIQSPPGSYAALAVGAALLLFVFVTDSLTKDKKKEKPEDDAVHRTKQDTE